MAKPERSTKTSAADFLPSRLSLPTLREAAAGCRGCELCETGVRTVFGEGPASARYVFVGEQPGDQEEKTGRPFVGPAGRMLDTALEEAGIERTKTYVTNAVKHFRFEMRGKRRIHSKPLVRHVRACRPWLEAEIEVVKPDLVVALGATAAQAMMGSAFRITKDRGRVYDDTEWARLWMATAHPSAILRQPDDESRRTAYAALVSDLRAARSSLDG